MGITVVFLFFFSFAKPPVVKTTWENCSRPLRSYRKYYVIHCSSLYASLSDILGSVRTEWCYSIVYNTENFLLPGYENGNFLNGEISFSVRKSYFI